MTRQTLHQHRPSSPTAQSLLPRPPPSDRWPTCPPAQLSWPGLPCVHAAPSPLLTSIHSGSTLLSNTLSHLERPRPGLLSCSKTDSLPGATAGCQWGWREMFWKAIKPPKPQAPALMGVSQAAKAQGVGVLRVHLAPLSCSRSPQSFQGP